MVDIKWFRKIIFQATYPEIVILRRTYRNSWKSNFIFQSGGAVKSIVFLDRSVDYLTFYFANIYELIAISTKDAQQIL